MSTDRACREFAHYACLYGDEEEFLSTAVPFAEEGLAAGESVLAATTPANIQLLRDALGARAHALDTADTAYFGRRPVDRVAAFLRYWKDCRAPGRPVRMIAEPVWAGKCARQISELKRLESGFNVLLAHMDARLICLYDTRVVPDHVVDSAWATHPRHVVGDLVLPCGTYTDPESYAAAGETPLPPPPPGAALLEPPAPPAAVRHFARLRAEAAGLADERVAQVETLANEALPGCWRRARPMRNCGPGRSRGCSCGTCWAWGGRRPCRDASRASHRRDGWRTRRTGCGCCGACANRWRSAGRRPGACACGCGARGGGCVTGPDRAGRG